MEGAYLSLQSLVICTVLCTQTSSELMAGLVIAFKAHISPTAHSALYSIGRLTKAFCMGKNYGEKNFHQFEAMQQNAIQNSTFC